MISRNLRNIIIGSAITLGVAAISIPVTIHLVQKNKNSKSNDEFEKIDQPDQTQTVFSELNKNDYYSFARYNGLKMYWDKNVVGAVVQDVIKTLKNTEGEVNFNYKFFDDKKRLEVYFKWLNSANQRPVYKTYILSLEK